MLKFPFQIEQVLAVFPDQDRNAVAHYMKGTRNVNTTIETIIAGELPPAPKPERKLIPPLRTPPVLDSQGNTLTLTQRKEMLLQDARRCV